MLAASLCLALVSLGGEPFRATSLAGAVAAAKSEKKLVLLDFRSEASEVNKKFEKQTLAESHVRSFLADKLVAIRVDLDLEKKIAGEYGVDSAPTLVFLDAAGSEVDRIEGFVDVKTLLAHARGTLEGKDALFRLRARVESEGTPALHLELGRILLAKGLHDDALKEFVWCFDHGVEKDPSFAAKRNEEVVPVLHRLGQAYPAALEHLARRCDAAEESVLAGTASASDLDDVIVLGEKLGRFDRLVALWDALREQPDSDTARKRLGPHVFVVLFADARYKDALECVGDPVGEIETQIVACKEDEKRAGPVGAGAPGSTSKDAGAAGASDGTASGGAGSGATSGGTGAGGAGSGPSSGAASNGTALAGANGATPGSGAGTAASACRRDVLQLGGRYYEVLLGAGEEAGATLMLERLLAFDATVATYERLMEHAVKADKPWDALAIGRRGISEKSPLSKDDKKRVRRAIEALSVAHEGK